MQKNVQKKQTNRRLTASQYAPNSLKAKLCIAGRKQLYQYCEEHAIPHKRVGKLIVASNEAQAPGLQALLDTAARNSVDDLRWLTADEAHAMEPEVRCAAALFSPSTGIVDSHRCGCVDVEVLAIDSMMISPPFTVPSG